ncbi:MAG: hypothetical protein KC983_12350 [Phycisphaerales bacterium]|nr:hypothetical protein [Phycisphaerales bacterium]
MSDHVEHNPNDHEDPAGGSTWIIGIFSVLLFVILCLGLVAMLYNARQAEFQHKVVDADRLEFQKLRATQLSRLDGPARREVVKDQNGNVLSEALVIPVDQAIELVTQQY